MTGILCGLGLLLMTAICFSFLLGRAIEKTLPLACFAIILIMYVFSAVGVMALPLLIVLWGLTVGLAAFTFWRSRKGGIPVQEAGKLLLTPGFFVFIVLTVFFFFFTRGLQSFQFDDFTHWTYSVKKMVYTDCLSIYETSYPHYFRSYPPAMALWQYLFANYTSTYSDQNVIFAYNLFCVLLLLPMFSTEGRSKLRWAVIPLSIILILLLPYQYYDMWEGAAWRTTYIDRAMAISFAYLLFCCYAGWDEKITGYALTGCGAVLCLMKDLGMALWILALVLTIPVWRGGNRLLSREQRQNPGKRLIFCSLAVLAFFFSWKLLLNIQQVHSLFGQITPAKVFALLTGREEAWRYETVSLVWGSLTMEASHQETIGALKLNYLLYPFVWFCMLAMTALLKRNRVLRQQTVNQERGEVPLPSWLAIVLTYAAYIFGVILIYCYTLSREEALMMASFLRYMSVFTLAISFLLLSLLFREVLRQEGKLKWAGLAGILAFTLLTSPMNQVLGDVFDRDRTTDTIYARTGFDAYRETEARYVDRLTPEDRVLVRWTGTYEMNILTKCLFPAHTDFYTTEELSALLASVEAGEHAPLDVNYFYDSSEDAERIALLSRISRCSLGSVELLNVDLGDPDSLPARYHRKKGDVSSPYRYGFYDDGFVEKECGFLIRSKKVGRNGLLIRVYNPAQLYEVAPEGKILAEISVNGTNLGAFDLSEGSVRIPAEQIPEEPVSLREAGIYYIDIQSRTTFVPSAMDANSADQRELAFILEEISAASD